MRYRYYRVGSPITDENIPAVLTGNGQLKIYERAGEVRCVVPYFSDHLQSDCYGYVEYEANDGAFPPPCIMVDGWSPLYVIMDAEDTRPPKESKDDSKL